MIDGYLLNMRVFNNVSDSKGQALKPLEEAAEVFGAWQELDAMRNVPAWRDMRNDLIDECVDTVQAAVNMLAAVGATQGEVDAAIKRMDERNGSRGRLWEMEEKMANIESPKDAEGREIPLDTSGMFIADGTMVHVVKFEYMYYTCDARGSWFVHFNRTSGEHMILQPCDVHLTPPDSWKKLEEDLDMCIEVNDPCRYYCTDGICKNCTRPDNDGDGCPTVVFSDIKKRIRKLRGEDE